MITIWKQRENRLVRSAILERNSWIQVTKPTELEIQTLEHEYHIDPDIIRDVLDTEERSRTEKNEDILYIILRVPVLNSTQNNEPEYITVPLGIAVFEDIIITICLKEPDFLRDFLENRISIGDIRDFKTFVLKVLLRVTKHFLSYLKEINRKTSSIEKDLQKSIRNTELVRLLTFEKSLVFFTTSLKSNELLIEKLSKSLFRNLSEEQQDILDDVQIESKQAIEMANIYSNILSGMMDAFASVISNNLNVVMKRLTMISITLMVPTFIASLYGMNVSLPFQNSPFAFTGILIVCGISAALSSTILSLRRIFS